jgi:hypothetical protein
MLDLLATCKSLPFLYEIVGEESVEFSYETVEKTKKNENEKDNFSLYKIPKYLEKFYKINLDV